MPVQKMIFKCLQFVIINFDDFDITKMYFYIATQRGLVGFFDQAF